MSKGQLKKHKDKIKALKDGGGAAAVKTVAPAAPAKKLTGAAAAALKIEKKPLLYKLKMML